MEPVPTAPDPRRWIGLFAALMAPFLGVVDFFVVNLAMPALERDLGASFAEQELVIALYALGYAVFVVTGGRLGDTHGRRRMFLVGLSAFVAASVLCAAATSPWWLLAARALQGVTAALVFPQVLALITVLFPDHERPKALAYFGLVVALASITGQALGGVLLHFDAFGLGWRALFLINLPLGAVAFVVAQRTLREVRTERPPTLDLGGVAIATAVLSLVLVPLTLGHEEGWPAWSIACLVAAIPALWLFVRMERATAARGRDPLVDLSLFADTGFRRGLAMIGTYFFGMGSIYLVLSLFEQHGLGRDALEAAYTFLPAAGATLVASLIASNQAAKRPALFLWTGLACVIAGVATMIAALAVLDGTPRDVVLASGLLVFSFGNGCISPVVYSTILRGVPPRSAGSASGVLATVQQTSAAFGVASIGLVFATALGGASGAAAHAHAAAVALCVNLATLFAAVALAWRLPRSPRAPSGDVEVAATH